MTAQHLFDIDLPDPAATEALGRLLADHTVIGDTLLLSGPIGTGKSHLSRAFIRHRLARMEDVPSPTFTLVQSYDDPAGDIWHADLYRLTNPDEVVELGLEDAFATAICLIEWPDRLGNLVPTDPVDITLAIKGDGRHARITFANRPGLAAALANV